MKKSTIKHNSSFDFLRTIAMLGVILYHTAGAYSYLSPYWAVQDSRSIIGDGLRGLLDTFIMPFFLFIAGYFFLPSIRNSTFRAFISNKFKRIGSYWLFIVLIFLPFVFWKLLQLNGNYFDYWLASLLNFKDIKVGPLMLNQYNHMHFWFISLLFYIFILFGISYKIIIKYLAGKFIGEDKTYQKMNVSVILIFGFLTTIAYYISIQVYPDSSWVIVPLILQFNITHLLILILYFGFGVYSSYREWFTKKDLPLNNNLWILLALFLTIIFFVIGQDIFKNTDISNTLPPVYLLFFSLIRSFLILSYLIMFLSLAIVYFNKENKIIKKIADVSYEIYLVHMFSVVGFQMFFKQFEIIPAAVKICIIFIIGTFISYIFAKFTLNKFPKISAAVMFILFFVLMIIFNR